MYKHIRNLLFKVDAERVHHWVMKMLLLGYKLPFIRAIIKKQFTITHPSLERTLWGIHFPNPVGLAAGFDKDAKYTDALSCLGFGHIEIGTLTPKAQPGNDKPRLFRLPKDRALINRMGFNNHGAIEATDRLAKRKENVVIGGNIGKNKVTPNEQATDDYLISFKALYNQVDYFVVNVSSPNTPGLRALQEKAPLTQLLNQLQGLNKEMGNKRPILLKIAPDLTNEQLDDIIEIVQTTQLHGIVATNTTIARNNLKTDTPLLEKIGAGGLSGAPVKNRATEVIRYISLKSQGKIPIIAVGGIFTGADALEKLKAGASLVQVYTGFIYEGPAIVRNICKSLLTSDK